MIHCWLKAYLNFRGCQQTGRWFDLPRGLRLLLFSLPPPSFCCSVGKQKLFMALWEHVFVCLPGPPAPVCQKVGLFVGRYSLASKFLTGLLLPLLGTRGKVKAWLDCSLLFQQLRRLPSRESCPTLGRLGCDVLLASQKPRIHFMSEECTWPTNSPQQVDEACAHARQHRRKGMPHVEVREIVLQVICQRLNVLLTAQTRGLQHCSACAAAGCCSARGTRQARGLLQPKAGHLCRFPHCQCWTGNGDGPLGYCRVERSRK